MTLSYAYPPTANDRLKDGFELRLALSFLAAILLHTLVFELWPAMEVQPWGRPDPGVMDVIPVDVFDLPPAPAPIARPALPVPTADVSALADVPIAPGWDQVARLPPPTPVEQGRTDARGVPFTPYTVEPSLVNPETVQRALHREYPAVLRGAGLGGTVYLLLHIDAQGAVLESRVDGTSGMASLDAAALRVADVFRFRPALNRDRPVEVWIRIPVTFQVRDPRPS